MDTRLKVWTDEELLALPKDDGKRELLEGAIIVSPAGSEHGMISVAISAELRTHVRRHKLGAVFDSSTGFRLTPADLLSPDVGFVARARLDRLARNPRGFFPGAPDLAVEVLSPFDSMAQIHQKMARYFAHGTRLAWVINPAERNALLYHGPIADGLLRPSDALDGESVVPGFRLPLTELFADLAFD